MLQDYSAYIHGNEDHDCWDDAKVAIAHCRTVLLFGPPGCGKTQFTISEASKHGRVEVATFDSDTTRYNLALDMMPPEFKPRPGHLLRAWTEGVLVINEIDRVTEGSGETAMHWGLDDPGIASWTDPDGNNYRPHKGFRCYASMNGIPEELPAALRDRFQSVVLIDKPHPGILASFSDPAIRKLAEALFSDSPANWPATPRNLRAVDALIARGVGVEQAFRIVVPETANCRSLVDSYVAHS